MKKFLISILFALGVLFGITVPAHGQSYGLYQNCSLQTAQGQAVAGAQVYFLTQPANTTNLTPQAQVYSSSTGGTVTQPLTTNGFGECSAYLAPGLYTVVYVSPYTGTRIYSDQAVYLPSGASTLVNPITNILWPIASGTSLPSGLCPTAITGNLTSGSPTILGVSSFTNVLVNQQVTGTGIPSGSGTYVQSINASAGSITLTQSATTTQSGVSLSFYSVGQPFQDTSNNAEYFCSLSGWQEGVQQIVAGTNIEISPSGGTGVVTITSLSQAAAPYGSLQYNDGGVFGASNSDWNTTTANAFTFGTSGTVGFNVNGSLAGINLNTSGDSSVASGGSISLTTNVGGVEGSYNSGDINLTTEGSDAQGGNVNIDTDTSNFNGGDINLSSTSTGGGGGNNITITTSVAPNDANGSSGNLLVSLTSNCAAGFGRCDDANTSFDQTTQSNGANFSITLDQAAGVDGFDTSGGNFVLETQSQATGLDGGNIQLSADSVDTGGGNFELTTTGYSSIASSNITLDSAGDLNLQGSLTTKGGVLPSLLYSAAGTPLPTCASASNGQTLVVSDATSPTYFGAYTSGGGITAPVVCSYDGTSYGWVTY